MRSRRVEVEELHADGALRRAHLRFERDGAEGWRVLREEGGTLRLGAGYRLLEVESCGVCATDLARPHLPFPLPQVVGHEVVALDDEGRRVVVEINASHRARGVETDCPHCLRGLDTHCPERMVLGIDRLPGGFGPVILAPRGAVLLVPEVLPTRTAVLAEPFAAALHAIEVLDPRDGDRVGILGPRRLGLLMIAALDAWRRWRGRDLRILAWPRRTELLSLALELGADEARLADEVEAPGAEIVIDATGNPAALDRAAGLAGRELHLKSTTGRRASGLDRVTEAVVDEIGTRSLASVSSVAGLALEGESEPVVVSTLPREIELPGARVLRFQRPEEALRALEEGLGGHPLRRADAAIVADAAGWDAAVRPVAGRETSLVRPRGRILIDGAGPTGSSLLDRVATTGLVVSTSRCGSFARALDLLARDPRLRDLGSRFVTHVFPRGRLAEAFAAAAGTECVKALVVRPEP